MQTAKAVSSNFGSQLLHYARVHGIAAYCCSTGSQNVFVPGCVEKNTSNTFSTSLLLRTSKELGSSKPHAGLFHRSLHLRQKLVSSSTLTANLQTRHFSHSVVRNLLSSRFNSLTADVDNNKAQFGKVRSRCVLRNLRHKSGGKNTYEEFDEETLDDDDYDAPPNFKTMKIHVKSLRADSLVSSALDISRNRVDEIFYNSRLRLNGEKLLKKSQQISERDYVDVIVEKLSEEEKLIVKRVKVIGISAEKTNKDKTAVTVKVWKNAFPIAGT